MKSSALLIFIMLAGLIADAQRGKLTISVQNDQQAGLENITVELVRAKDSALVKAGITDKTGKAELENLRLRDHED